LFGGSDQSGTSSQGGATTSSAQPASEGSSEVTITYSSDGFSPSSVKVNSGGTVTWANNSTKEVEIGANPHPIHTGNKEVSGGEFVLKLASGEKSSVTVTKTGTFGYHNHLDSSQGGSITVE
jgi:plastocyanin